MITRLQEVINHHSFLIIAVLVIGLSACNGGGGGGNNSGSSSPSLQSVTISPGTTSVAKGLSASLTVTGQYSDGSSADLTSAVSWHSSDPDVAVVSDQGAVVSVDLGTTAITASLDGVDGQADVTVTDALLVGIDVQPSAANIAAGLTTNFSATGHYTDGSQQDITDQVVWSAADGAIASVVSQASGAGTATGLASGSTAITASLSGLSDSGSVTVSSAVLTAIELSPPQATFATGTTTALTATGVYSDASQGDLTSQVTWGSSDESVATVSAAGVVTAVTAGSANITATLSTFSPSATVTVTAATLDSLAISPTNPSLVSGTTLALTATGYFSDGSVQDLSSEVSWGSSDETVATIAPTAGQILVTGVTAGTTTLQASFAGQNATTLLTVTDASLVSINITPGELQLAQGTSVRLQASGNYDDGSTQNLTTQLQWDSGNTAVATVNSEGVVTALPPASSPSSTRINASMNGVTGSVVVVVTNATLVSIEVVADSSGIAAGSRTGVRAMGHFSDNTTQDLSDQVVWSSDVPSVAGISQDSQEVFLGGLAAGAANISASFGGVDSAPLSVTVSDATLTSISLSAYAAAMPKGTSLQMTAVGNYDDATTQDLTGQVVWTSSDPSIAVVSNADADRGKVTAVGACLVADCVTITATFGAVSADYILDVVDDPDAPLSLVMVATPNVIYNDGNESTTLQVTVQAVDPGATVPDGTTVNLEIVSGAANLGAATTTTTNGVASVSMTSTHHGLIVLKATVPGTNIENTVPVYATDNFSEVFSGYVYARGELNSGVVQAGMQFGLYILNISNRTFNLDAFRFFYNDGLALEITAPEQLNNHQLAGGEQIGMVVELNTDFPNAPFVSVFYLTDPVTAEPFTLGARYNLTE